MPAALCAPVLRSSPSSLTVHYTLKNVGMEYDRSLFGMKLADCRALAKCLEKTEVGYVRSLFMWAQNETRLRLSEYK